MEIAETIGRMLESPIEADKRLGLEILKSRDYNNFNWLLYHYRWYLTGDIIYDYFKYTLDGDIPTSSGITTRVKIISWR